eukprot:7043079-Heterocapsa_arctica.AAC.1
MQEDEVRNGISPARLGDAKAFAAECPSFWIRGISTMHVLPKPVQERTEITLGTGVWGPGRYYTDASGGE